jgi:hypothetical protein
VSQESTTTIALNKEEEWAIVLVPETLTVDWPGSYSFHGLLRQRNCPWKGKNIVDQQPHEREKGCWQCSFLMKKMLSFLLPSPNGLFI